MNTFPKRIAIIAKLVGSGQELANRAQISRRVIGKYLAGESDPSRDRLVAMADAAQVSVEWLAKGTGPMRQSGEKAASGFTTAEEQAMAQSLAKALDVIYTQMAKLLGKTPTAPATQAKPPTGHLPKARMIKWIEERWETADRAARLKMERDFSKAFPEYAEWKQENIKRRTMPGPS